MGSKAESASPPDAGLATGPASPPAQPASAPTPRPGLTPPDRSSPSVPGPGPSDALAASRTAPESSPVPGLAADPRSDAQLMADHRAGDAHAFAVLVERHHRELFRFLHRFTGSVQMAEDAIQEAFLQVHQSAASFDVDRSFRPWLYVIATNKARDRVRIRARQGEAPLQGLLSPSREEAGEYIDLLLSPEPDPWVQAAGSDEAARVRAVVDSMPPLLRQVLFLAYFEGHSYQQIAAGLELPIGTVKSRLHAAVAHFASRWKKQAQPHD